MRDTVRRRRSISRRMRACWGSPSACARQPASSSGCCRRCARPRRSPACGEQIRGRPPARGSSASLVASQTAVSLVLLVFMALFVRSLNNLWARDPGYVRANVAMFSTDARLAGKTRDRGAANLSRPARHAAGAARRDRTRQSPRSRQSAPPTTSSAAPPSSATGLLRRSTHSRRDQLPVAGLFRNARHPDLSLAAPSISATARPRPRS